MNSRLLTQKCKCPVVKDINHITKNKYWPPEKTAVHCPRKCIKNTWFFFRLLFYFFLLKVHIFCTGKIKPSCHWSWQAAFLWRVQARDKNGRTHPSRPFHSYTPTLATNEECAAEPWKFTVVCGNHYSSECRVPVINPACCTQVFGGFYYCNTYPHAGSRVETFIHAH